MRIGKARAPSAQSVTFRTPNDAANFLRKRYPFTPSDKLSEWDLCALENLMRAHGMPERHLTALEINELIETWSDPDHSD